MNGTCIIIGAGDFFGFVRKPEPEDYIIAADAGYRYCLEEGITPDLIVGDFDSYGERPDFPNIVQMPVEKDDTDTLHAVRLGLEKDCRRFELYGGTGGRSDHTLANIQTLYFITSHGARGILYGDRTAYRVISEEKVLFPEDQEGDLSVFCLDGKAEGVTIQGAKYEISDAVITSDFPIGVSNSFCHRPCSVEVKKGSLLLYYHF